MFVVFPIRTSSACSRKGASPSTLARRSTTHETFLSRPEPTPRRRALLQIDGAREEGRFGFQQTRLGVSDLKEYKLYVPRPLLLANGPSDEGLPTWGTVIVVSLLLLICGAGCRLRATCRRASLARHPKAIELRQTFAFAATRQADKLVGRGQSRRRLAAQSQHRKPGAFIFCKPTMTMAV